jgi:cytochrome c1
MLGVAALVACCIAWPLVASSRTKLAAGDAEAGRALALQACTGCHVVQQDQRFKPVFTGPPHPPDFKDIANAPHVTAASLQHHLKTLPTVPQQPSMANPDLTSKELRDVVAFILTLRDAAVTPR